MSKRNLLNITGPIILCGMVGLFVFGSSIAKDQAFQSSEKMPLATSAPVMDIQQTGKQLVAVGDRGHILRSADCGKSWEQVQTPVRVMLTAVYFVDENNGWAVGHDAIILATRDGGVSWKEVYRDPKAETPLFDVWFRNKQEGIAVGAYGTYLETRDGGKSWKKRQISQDDYHLYRFVRMSVNAWFLIGETGSVYRSEDLGKTWKKLRLPYEGTFFGGLATAKGRLLVYGMRGHLYASDDRGESWKKIETATISAIEGAVVTEGEQVELVGHGGLWLISDDNGNTFKQRKSSGRIRFSTLLQCRSGVRILVGERGVKRVE